MVDRSRAIAALVFVSACAGAQKPAAPELSARDYAPIPVGASWTYEMEFPGQKGEMTVRLSGEKDGFVLFDDGKGQWQHTQAGLRDSDRFLIRHPLVVGTEWKSVVGPSAVEHMKIESVGRRCESVAGAFDDCLVVLGWIRRDKDVVLYIRWFWARNVGLVKVETEAEIAGKGKVPQTRQSLKHYSLSGGEAPARAETDDGPDTWVTE